MGLSKVSPYVPNPLRCFKCQKFRHDQGQCKGKIRSLIVQKKTSRVSIVITMRRAPIVVNLTWLHLKTVNIFSKKKTEIQNIKSEKNISYPESRRFVSAANDSPAQNSYASTAKRVFNSVETQTMLTWIDDNEKPTRLTVNPKEKKYYFINKII